MRPKHIFLLVAVLPLMFGPVRANEVGAGDDIQLEARVQELLRKADELAAKNRIPCPVTLVRVQPDYPSEAVAKSLKGWVLVGFTVNERGVPEEPFLLAAHPTGVFEQAALDVILLYKYRPVIVDNRPQKFEYFVERVDFLPLGNVPGNDWPMASQFTPAYCGR